VTPDEAAQLNDAAAMLDAMAAPQPGDLSIAPPLPDGESFLGWTRRDPGRLRIGRHLDPGSPDVAIDPEVRRAYEETTELLVSLGHDVEEIAPPFGAAMQAEFLDVWSVRSLRVPLPSDDGLLRISRFWRERGRGVDGERFLRAVGEIQARATASLVASEPYDAILTPTLALPPQPPSWFTEGDELLELDRQFLFAPYPAVQNVTGQPSAGLPLHWTADGLPIGVMLSGRLNEDALLLSLCAQLEAARPWAGRRPTL
ncbi:amidase family protein, partial [Actinocorallia lasiicapitis]